MTNHHGAASVERQVKKSAESDQDGTKNPAASTGNALPIASELDGEDDVLSESYIPLTEIARLRLTSAGYFVLGYVPYGMKAIRERQWDGNSRWRSRTRLGPGDPQEVKVVRLIFELYACQEMPLNHILNSLLAQKIPSRKNSSPWTLQKIERLLSEPIYIGATRYKNLVCHGAFQPIIEPWMFHAAQSRRYFDKMSKSGSMVHQELLGSLKGGTDD